MASTATGSSIFDQLKRDPLEDAKREEDYRRREYAQHGKAQKRLADLVTSNSTLPTTISSVTVLNAQRTRRGFLERIFNPILSANNAEPYTLDEAVAAIGKGVDTLNRLDIYHSPISTYLDRPDPTDPSTSPTDIAAFVNVREKGRFAFSAGTWAGSNDGSVYSNLLVRNVFGGAESLNANVSYGTRTRSAYGAVFETPILSNPRLKWEFGGLASSTRKEWASHEEVLKSGYTKLRWLTGSGSTHDIAYNGIWRQVTGLSEKASPTVRADAGDSVKSSITHTWTNDQRDHPLMPTRGYLLKTTAELAGLGPLSGDVSFGKVESESQIAIPFGETGASFTAGLRGGLLYPLSQTLDGPPQASRINDRFTLGGPTDVRGFRLAGLGPRDGSDAVGGDLYAAGGASILLPFPRVKKETPLRLQAFINGGRLIALQDSRPESSREGNMDAKDIRQSVQDAARELGNGLPSMSIGLGVVYSLPVARFELNFSLPIAVRKGEEARKGLAFGVGISFL